MTTQEARIKNDIKRKEQHNKYSELYFPNLRSTFFEILTGQNGHIEKATGCASTATDKIKNIYAQLIKENADNKQTPINIEFTDDGINFIAIIYDTSSTENNGEPEFMTYQTLTWDEDRDLLTLIAKTLNTVILQCTRLIPNLCLNRRDFRTINLIETNPIYEYMAFVFAMYHKLNISNILPGCYIQSLMAKKRISYNLLCHMLKYSTKLPESATQWFKGGNNIIYRQTYTPRRVDQTDENTTTEGIQNNDDINETEEIEEKIQPVALHMPDYTGTIFSHRLELRVSPKMKYENSRFLHLDGDATITG